MLQTNIDNGKTPGFEQRITTVNALTTRYRQAFDRWTDDQSHTRNFNALPQDVLRYLFISEPLLYFAQNPENVRVEVESSTRSRLAVLVAEKRDFPLTDKKSYEELIPQYLDYLKRSQFPYRTTNITPPTIPTNIDLYHLVHHELVKTGLIDLNDLVMNHFLLSVKNQQLIVLNYEDRFRHINAARKLYQKWDIAMKQLGFRYIGGNNFDNPDFFLKALGRHKLTEIKPEYRRMFLPEFQTGNFQYYTIRFLYPNDKRVYLIKPPS